MGQKGKTRGKPFQKGQSGNPNGRPKHPSFREVCEKDHPELIELWWRKLQERIKKGDSKVLIWMGDQLNGKAPQRLELTGQDGATLMIRVGPSHGK